MWFKPSRCVSCFLAALPLDIPAACHLEVADMLFSFAVTVNSDILQSLSPLICRSWLFKVSLSLWLIWFHSIMHFTKKFRIHYRLDFEKGARGTHSDYAMGLTIWDSMPGTGNRFVSSPKHPDWLWDPHSPLFYRYQGLLSWAHSACACRWPCTSVECPVELYLCSLPTFLHDMCSDNFIRQMKHQLDAALCRFYFCRVTLHVSGASAHHQEYLKLVQRPLVHVFSLQVSHHISLLD